MPALSDMIGHGSTLSYYSTSASWSGTTVAPTGGSWVAIGDLTDVSIPSEEADDVETTHMGSTAKTKTFKAGLVDPGSIDFTAQYTDSQYDALRALRSVDKAWKIEFEDLSGVGFNGYLKSLGGEVPREDLITINGTVKLSGPTYDIDAA